MRRILCKKTYVCENTPQAWKRGYASYAINNKVCGHDFLTYFSRRPKQPFSLRFVMFLQLGNPSFNFDYLTLACVMLSSSWALLMSSWGYSRPPWNHPGALWGHLGDLLGPRLLQDGPRRPQDGRKGVEKSPKMTPREPKRNTK